MQALRRSVWAEDLQGHLQALRARHAEPASAPTEPEDLRPGFDPSPPSDGALFAHERRQHPDENVVRPAIFNRDTSLPSSSPRARPDLSAAVATVLKATEWIKGVELEADRKAQRAVDIAFRTLAKLEETETKLEASYGAIRTLEEKASATARAATRQLEAAHLEISGSREHASALEEQVDLLSAQLAEAAGAIERATSRAFAAETRAQEALDDLQQLADHVSRMFAPRPRPE